MINFIKKIKVGLMALLGAIGFSAANAYAAVDADIASTTSGMASTVKENLMGVLITNLPTIVIVGVAVLAIGFIWRLFRRFAK
jgi:uncharacterized membrane protein